MSSLFFMFILPFILNNLTFFFKKSYGRVRGCGKIILRFRGGGVFTKKKHILQNYPLSFSKILVIKIYKDCAFRSAFVAKVLCEFKDYFKYYYIIIHSKSKVGDIYYNMCNFNVFDLHWDFFSMNAGNLYCVKNLPVGTLIYNLERYSRCGCSLIRAAGCFGVIIKHDIQKQVTFVKLPSKFLICVPFLARANLGVVSNENSRFFNCRIAGYYRRLGVRPRVRGVAMNSVDHPHGGGRGKTKGGRPSVSIWGWLTKGKKTVHYR